MSDTPETAPLPPETAPAAAESIHGASPQPEVMPSLEEMLKTAELKAAEHHDAWLRAKAEGENIRRRAQEDIAKAGKFAVEKFAGELLAVKDSLEAALTNENQDAAALGAGVELTLKQLVAAFEKSGLNEVHPLGEKFDPHRHQAISQIDAPAGTAPGSVLTVLQKGYLLHERVIRPALVIVAKAPDA
ncbi:MAG: nucleotide exchange factor GrpE [Proteobacteria bacterium]|nr:nucleotide exchange factor GrpE [Pseudomonadota bacterium]HQR04019.1 nucleotide exchange factor GrpE [Rhodocyclaceae bacterium]